MRFIELTSTSPRSIDRLLINLEHVRAVIPPSVKGEGEGCKLQYSNGDTINVKESYTLVCAMLRGEVRGRKPISGGRGNDDDDESSND
jgi:hypothetical protein